LREIFAGCHGILVPGGFGDRGIPGKVNAIRFAREQGIPFLGICLGLQCAMMEIGRDVVGLERAGSAEFDPDTPHPVIHLMEKQKGLVNLGGTMRLGAYPCRIDSGSLAHRCYGRSEISERHRHRYEVNNDYREAFTRAGVVFSGTSPDGNLVEIMELPGHPFFIAAQFHPELKSRPRRPHPLFRAFVAAAVGHRDGVAPPLAERAAGETAERNSRG
jgi:CTP synthase